MDNHVAVSDLRRMETHPIRRILVGIDQGELSAHALPLAMDLATTFGAKLDVVHAVDIHPPSRGNASAERWAENSAKALAAGRRAMEGRLSLVVEHPHFADQPVEDYLHTLVGRPAQVLLDFASDHGVDLLVLGGHKHRKLFDFGGTARGVLGQAHCPLWIQTGPAREVERILVAVDLSEGSQAVMSLAREFARVLDATVDVLHCFQPPVFAYDPELGESAGTPYVIEGLREDEQESFGRFFEAFDWQGVEATAHFVDGDPSTEILAGEKDHQLLVLGTHGRTGLARAVLGSEAYKVLKHANGSVLVVPQQATELLG